MSRQTRTVKSAHALKILMGIQKSVYSVYVSSSAARSNETALKNDEKI